MSAFDIFTAASPPRSFIIVIAKYSDEDEDDNSQML